MSDYVDDGGATLLAAGAFDPGRFCGEVRPGPMARQLDSIFATVFWSLMVIVALGAIVFAILNVR